MEQPILFTNGHSAHTYGFEISTVWQMSDWFRWDAHYSLLKTGFGESEGKGQLSSSPQQHVSLRSILTPWKNVDIDLLFRYVDTNTAISIQHDKPPDDIVDRELNNEDPNSTEEYF